MSDTKSENGKQAGNLQVPGELLRDRAVAMRVQSSLSPEDTTTALAIENVIHLLKACNEFNDSIGELLEPVGLTPAKYNLLSVLWTAAEYRLPMSEIGDLMCVTRTNITKLVDGLEREGLVRRTSLPGDRRVVLAELTATGRRLIRSIRPKQCANIRSMCAEMTEHEQHLLTHLLLRFRASLRAAASADGLKPLTFDPFESLSKKE